MEFSAIFAITLACGKEPSDSIATTMPKNTVSTNMCGSRRITPKKRRFFLNRDPGTATTISSSVFHGADRTALQMICRSGRGESSHRSVIGFLFHARQCDLRCYLTVQSNIFGHAAFIIDNHCSLELLSGGVQECFRPWQDESYLFTITSDIKRRQRTNNGRVLTSTQHFETMQSFIHAAQRPSYDSYGKRCECAYYTARLEYGSNIKFMERI
ncbi:hypothetical protein T4D_5540 [Trichinella pseudospiralis]|uniref:Uncharacterized protein n=1 Tax=Trichinella pseudospiralis TaxID=6337 RepID=A0A0V1F3H5_TRIPS|nr:hypothetical protein T4D_5540 [Trichinella pseudospiralis]